MERDSEKTSKEAAATPGLGITKSVRSIVQPVLLVFLSFWAALP